MGKYIEGSLITNIENVLNKDFIFVGTKLYHKGWFMSWQVSTLQRYVNRHMVYEALDKDTKSYYQLKVENEELKDVIKQILRICDASPNLNNQIILHVNESMKKLFRETLMDIAKMRGGKS